MKRNKKKGFSLIEVIITIAILAVIIVPLSAMTITSNKKAEQSETEQKASIIGQQYLEELAAYSSIGITLNSSNEFNLLNNNAIVEKKLTANLDASNNITDLVGSFNLASEYQDTPYTVNVNMTRDTNGSYNDQVTISTETKDEDCDYVIMLKNGNKISVNGGLDLLFNSPDLTFKLDNNLNLVLADNTNSYNCYPRDAINLKRKIKFTYSNDYDKSNAQRNFKIFNTYVDNMAGIIIEKTFNRDKLTNGASLTNLEVDNHVLSPVKIVNNVFNETTVRYGDLYNIYVSVNNSSGDVLFEGSTATNIRVIR